MTLGEAIRKRRTSLKLRLVDLAQKIGLSPSYLSQVERDRICPSVTALGRIADGLSTTVSALFESTEGNQHRISPVVCRNKRKVLMHPDSPTRNELVTPDLSGRLEVLWCHFPPGAKGPIFKHEGEECGVILKGELTCWVGEERYILRAGDAITHKSNIPHRSENLSGKTVEAIWIITPPSF